jgi:site-specific recombinase XerD
MPTERNGTHLAAVPDPPALDPAHAPDWPELAESFAMALRIAGRSPRTIETYIEGCERFAAWLATEHPGKLIEQASTAELRVFLGSLADAGNAPNTIATRHRALRALFGFLTTEQIVADDPMRKIPTPSITEERTPPVLTSEQIDAMVKACPRSTFLGARDGALIALLASSGLRASEALGLTEADVCFGDEPHVTVKGKGGRHRNANMSREAALAIRRYLRKRAGHQGARSSALWLSRTGGPLTLAALRQAVQDAARRAGVDGVRTHALRHTATDAMLRRGMAEHDVATQLGHSGTKQLARYGRANTAERSRASFFRTLEGKRS